MLDGVVKKSEEEEAAVLVGMVQPYIVVVDCTAAGSAVEVAPG